MNIADIQKGIQSRPPRIVLCGVEKIGKSSWAAGAPKPLFIPIAGEEGIDALDVARTPVIETYGELMEAIGMLAEQQHDYETVVIDSISTLEPLVWDHLIKTAGVGHERQVGGLAVKRSFQGNLSGFSLAAEAVLDISQQFGKVDGFQAQGKLSWEMEVLAKSDGGRGLPPKPSLFRPSVDAVTGELIDIGATKGLARPATPAPVPEAQTVSLAVDAASGEVSAPPADRRARHPLPAVGAGRWGRPAVLRRPRRLPAEAKAELGASRCWAVPPPGTAQQRTIAPSGHMVGYLRATTG